MKRPIASAIPFLTVIVLSGLLAGCSMGGGGGGGTENLVIAIANYVEGTLSDGDSTAERTQVVVCADVPDPDPDSASVFDGTVRVYVNGTYVLANVFLSDTFYFTQPITLISGKNTIYAAVYTLGETEYVRSETYTITGTFANPLYRAQLTWDTNGNDVDIHLVKDDGWGEPGTHCFWLNDKISGMAALDYDDVDGYGPENMSLELTAPSGSYKIYVKYFDAYPVSGDVQATVRVYDQDNDLIGTYNHTFTIDDVSDDDLVYNPAKDWYVTEWVVSP